MMSKHPSSVTFLLWMVLSLTAWNAIRLGAAIAQWNLLLEFTPRPGPFYVALSAAFWTLAGFALWLTIRRRSPRARFAAAAFALGYAAWWWADRLLLQEPRPNTQFAIAVTILLLAFSASLLYHPRTKEYFQQRESHAPNPSDQHPA